MPSEDELLIVNILLKLPKRHLEITSVYNIK